MMPGLTVPFGKAALGRLITPDAAVRTDSYSCPSCGDPLLLRQGPQRVPHFAHRQSITCTRETVTHATAKLLVQQTVLDWIAGRGPAPKARLFCRCCGAPKERLLSSRIDSATLEQRLPCGSIADVALSAAGKLILAVEIKVTHAVDDAKAERLSMPYLELDGNAILAEPLVWEARRHTLRPVTCAACDSRFQQFQTQMQRIAQTTGVSLPDRFYRYGPHDCWNCCKEMLIFCWPGHMDEPSQPPAASRRPRTIQYRRSSTRGMSYWGNVCPYCNRLQGSVFLTMGGDSSIFGLPCEDTPEGFLDDLMIVASRVI